MIFWESWCYLRLAVNPRDGQIVEGERDNRKNKSHGRGKKEQKERKEKHIKFLPKPVKIGGALLDIATSFHKKI